MKKLRVCNRGDNFTLQQTVQKSIQFIQCLTIINENAEARRSLRSFPVVAWSGLQTRVISKAIENELADAKETFTVQVIHTSQLRSTCFSFETFTTLISQLNFVFHYFSSKQAFIFIFSIFFLFFHIIFIKQMFLFSMLYIYIFFLCLLGFSRVVALTDSHFRSPQLISYSP